MKPTVAATAACAACACAEVLLPEREGVRSPARAACRVRASPRTHRSMSVAITMPVVVRPRPSSREEDQRAS